MSGCVRTAHQSAIGIVKLEFHPLEGIPEIRPGDDLGGAIRHSLDSAGSRAATDDVIVVAQKVVSKAEGCVVRLADVEPSDKSLRIAASGGKDPRFVEVVLSETKRIVRERNGLIISETTHGFVCANAGVDQSNAPAGFVTLLPADPDRSASLLAERLGCGIVISDTFGRPWREGLVDVAIGVARVPALVDMRDQKDRGGRKLTVTLLGVADALAAAAGLMMPKGAGVPAVLVRGLECWDADSRISDLIRPQEEDLFR